MFDNVEKKLIDVNSTLYIDANFVLEYLKYIFDEVRDDANEDIVNDIENKIDIILEEIEYHEGERE